MTLNEVLLKMWPGTNCITLRNLSNSNYTEMYTQDNILYQPETSNYIFFIKARDILFDLKQEVTLNSSGNLKVMSIMNEFCVLTFHKLTTLPIQF